MSNTLFRVLNRVRARITPSVLNKTLSTPVTADEALYGAIVSNSGAVATVTFSLPAAAPGMRVTAVVKANQELRLDPSGTQTIALPSTGVQGAAGKYLTADAIGESGVFVCIIAGTWDYVGPIDGTWTAEA